MYMYDIWLYVHVCIIIIRTCTYVCCALAPAVKAGGKPPQPQRSVRHFHGKPRIQPKMATLGMSCKHIRTLPIIQY